MASDVVRAVRCLLVVASFVFSPGCDPEGSVPAPVQVMDSAGTIIVQNGEPRWGDGEAWTVPAEPVQTLGVLDGDERYQFFDISSAARRSDGGLVVADIGARTVRLYDHDGEFVKTLGGPGFGPGEFQRPTQVQVQANDSIFVWDDPAYRLTKFDSRGELVSVHTISREEIAKAVAPPLYPGTAQLLSGGELLVRLIEKAPAGKSPTGKGVVAGKEPSTERFRQQSGALRVAPGLTRIETVMFFDDVEQVAIDAPWGRFPVVPPFSPNTTVAVQPNQNRVCVGDQAGPEVRCIGADGSQTVVRWSARPIAVDENEKDVVAWREATIEAYSLKLSRDEASRVVDLIPVPATRPEYSEILIDRIGNLWVRRGPVRRGGAAEVEYLVFDPAGELLGALSMPPIHVLEIGPDYIVGVHQDELEVEYIRVFEIVKPETRSAPEP